MDDSSCENGRGFARARASGRVKLGLAGALRPNRPARNVPKASSLPGHCAQTRLFRREQDISLKTCWRDTVPVRSHHGRHSTAICTFSQPRKFTTETLGSHSARERDLTTFVHLGVSKNAMRQPRASNSQSYFTAVQFTI